eukprot:275275_1
MNDKSNDKKCSIAIELATTQIDEIKEYTENKSIDDENKYDQQLIEYMDEKYVQPFKDFPSLRVDDYIDCDIDLMYCPAVIRILHLLKYYKNIDIHSESKVSMYQY